VLLGVRTPWTVAAVEMDVPKQEVVVTVTHPSGTRFRCPQCERELAVFDHVAERRWRHLDSCQFMTYLQARPPRVHCPEHGKHSVALPWAEGTSRFTTMFEALAIEVLLATHVKGAAALLRITWAEAWAVMERAVVRGRAAKQPAVPAHIGVDEKAIAKGHQYMTIVSDLEGAHVEYIGEEPQEDVTALAEEFFAGVGARRGPRTIFAVGDEKQSIYSFQGAVPAYFDEMRRYFDQRAAQAQQLVEHGAWRHVTAVAPHQLGERGRALLRVQRRRLAGHGVEVGVARPAAEHTRRALVQLPRQRARLVDAAHAAQRIQQAGLGRERLDQVVAVHGLDGL